jgi:hypothetical protein
MDMAQQIEETLKRKDELERQTDGRGQQQTQPPRCGAADGDEDKDDAGNCRGGRLHRDNRNRDHRFT